MMMNARPAFKNTGTLLLRFRELEGQPGELNLSSAIAGKKITRIVEVNSTGTQIGQPVTSVKLKPYEVKFIEVEF
jgi:alpha-mannosidase